MTPDNQPSPGGPTVFGLGLIVLDQQVFVAEYPSPDTKVFAQDHRSQIGGPVPTALAQLRRFGVRCRLLGAWGRDAAGQEIESDLRAVGIEFDAEACRSAVSTGFAQVWVESPTGRRTVVSSPPVSSPDGVHASELAAGASALHLDGWGGDAAVAAAKAAQAGGALVTLDAGSVKPATEALLGLATVVNAPRRFLRVFCRTDDPLVGAKRLLDLGPRLVTVTDGDRGAGVYTRDIAEWLPAFPVAAVDTCGAGDVFSGGLIYANLAGLHPVESLRFAMAAAAAKVARPGNREALAALPTVEAFLHHR